MDPLALLIIFFVSVFVGVVTSMLGIGEGVLLVPFLTLGLGLPIQIAIATSLVSTIANSSAASMTYVKDSRLNLRLALLFALTATIGAIIGARVAGQIDGTLLTEVFAVALIMTSLLMILRLKEADAVQSTELLETHTDRLQLDGSYTNAVPKRTLTTT